MSVKSYIFSFILIFIPTIGISEPINSSVWSYLQSQDLFGKVSGPSLAIKNSIGTNQLFKTNRLATNLALSFDNTSDLKLDGSYLNYNLKNFTIGVGKTHRKWSFSPLTSLFLSNNARPADSIYLGVKNDTSTHSWLSKIGFSSFEIFNAKLKNLNGPKDTMMLGARVIIIPITNLEFEAIKISQWGGDGYNKSIKNVPAGFFGNTNEGPYANINQLAGIGVSYKLPLEHFPFHLYGQILGEDEAGALPSCTIYFLGLELDTNIMNKPTSVGLEFIDTRTNISKDGFCGEAAAYNNNTYRYTNYDVVMGPAIDSDGKMFNFRTSSKLTPTLKIEYSMKKILINDNNYARHSLSTQRERGLINSLTLQWQKDKIKHVATINHQDINLDKTSLQNGFSFSLLTQILF